MNDKAYSFFCSCNIFETKSHQNCTGIAIIIQIKIIKRDCNLNLMQKKVKNINISPTTSKRDYLC